MLFKLFNDIFCMKYKINLSFFKFKIIKISISYVLMAFLFGVFLR